MVKLYEDPLSITPESVVKTEMKNKTDTVWFFDCRQIINGLKFTKKESNFKKDGSFIEVSFKKDVPESLFAGEGARFFFLGLDPNNNDIIFEFRKLWADKKNGQYVGFGYFRDLKYTEGSNNLSYSPLGYIEHNRILEKEIHINIGIEERFKDAGFEF